MKTIAVRILMVFGLISGWVALPSDLFAAGGPGIETRPAARIPVKRVAPAVYFPNGAATTLTIPSGWGAHSNVAFIGAGITSPQAYSDDDDAGVSFGIGLGDPVEYVGVQLNAAVNDVSEGDNWSGGLKVHRYIPRGSSLAVGADHLFPDDESDADESYYIVFSHAVQQYPSDSGSAKLNFTIGAGNERFGKKSPSDVASGKGEDGTYVFGAAAYEIFDATNLVVDWNGLNLNAGVSIAPFRLIPGAEFIPLVVTLGAADLTTYSGDKVRFIASAGLSYKLF
jgi:hypothetical protein